MADKLGEDFTNYKTKTGLHIRKPIPRPERELIKQLHTDTLTRISSRLAVEKEYRRIEKGNLDAAMISVDIDHFKSVNDEYGHVIGDETLMILGSILQTHVKGKDIVGREGGEEFIILLPGLTDLEVARERAELLREDVEKRKFHLKNGTVLENTISIGVSVRQPGETTKSWRDRTDRALYEAKGSGRNKVVVAESS